MEKLLKQYNNMIHKKCCELTKKWKGFFLYEDVYGYAMEQFIYAVKTYDKKKASFSTHLFNQLRNINNKFLLKEFRKKKNDVYFQENYNFKSELFDKFCKVLEFYDSVETGLSIDAQRVLYFILSNAGERPKPSLHGARRYFRYAFDWTRKKTETVWNEVKEFWLNYSYAI